MYSPNDIFSRFEGAHTFVCSETDTTVEVEITRRGAARLLSGVMPSDIVGKDGMLEPDIGSCRGLELDLELTLRASNGLTATASTVQIGEQCDARWPGAAIVGRLAGEFQASFLGNPVDATITLTAGEHGGGDEISDKLTLMILHDKQWVGCSRVVDDGKLEDADATCDTP